MEEFITFLLKNYGLAGGLFIAVLLFAAYLIKLIIKHFIRSLERKDSDLSFLFERNAKAIDLNSKALAELSRTQHKLCSIMNNILEHMHLFREESLSDHKKMLKLFEDHIRI